MVKLFSFITVLWSFMQKNKRKPDTTHLESDREQLMKLRESVAESLELDIKIIPDKIHT